MRQPTFRPERVNLKWLTLGHEKTKKWKSERRGKKHKETKRKCVRKLAVKQSYARTMRIMLAERRLRGITYWRDESKKVKCKVKSENRREL